jgi:acyl-CoA thioesterase
MTNTITENFADQIEELRAVEMSILTGYTLADAIREGASVTDQAHNTFGGSGRACALSAAAIAAQARGYVQ